MRRKITPGRSLVVIALAVSAAGLSWWILCLALIVYQGGLSFSFHDGGYGRWTAWELAQLFGLSTGATLLSGKLGLSVAGMKARPLRRLLGLFICVFPLPFVVAFHHARWGGSHVPAARTDESSKVLPSGAYAGPTPGAGPALPERHFLRGNGG